MSLEDLADATTVGVRLTAAQLTAVIEVLDDHLATCPSPLDHRAAALNERLRLMYVEHARGRLRAALGQHRAGTPSTADAAADAPVWQGDA